MRGARFLLAALVALAAAGCMRHDAGRSRRPRRVPLAGERAGTDGTRNGRCKSLTCCNTCRRRPRQREPSLQRSAARAAAAPSDRALRGGACQLCLGLALPAAALHARCRRQIARRGVRPGRHYQHLHRRCRRQCEPAADRHRAGARHHHAAAVATHRRAAQAGLRARAACDGRGRDLPAVLHPRRGDHAGAVSLRRRHDGGEGDRDRRRLCAARLQADRRTDPQRARPADQVRRAAQLSACAPATPCWSRSGGSRLHPSSPRRRRTRPSRT